MTRMASSEQYRTLDGIIATLDSARRRAVELREAAPSPLAQKLGHEVGLLCMAAAMQARDVAHWKENKE